MKPLRQIHKVLATYGQTRPRLQRFLCRFGIHARKCLPLDVTWDGCMVWSCTACGRRFEGPGL